jgi:hypothetical protein
VRSGSAVSPPGFPGAEPRDRRQAAAAHPYRRREGTSAGRLLDWMLDVPRFNRYTTKSSVMEYSSGAPLYLYVLTGQRNMRMMQIEIDAEGRRSAGRIGVERANSAIGERG